MNLFCATPQIMVGFGSVRGPWPTEMVVCYLEEDWNIWRKIHWNPELRLNLKEQLIGWVFLFFLEIPEPEKCSEIRKNSTKGYCACWLRYLISTLSGRILPEAVWLVKSCIKFDFVPRVTSVESTRNPLKRNCSTTSEHQEIKFITVSSNLLLNPSAVE